MIVIIVCVLVGVIGGLVVAIPKPYNTFRKQYRSVWDWVNIVFFVVMFGFIIGGGGLGITLVSPIRDLDVIPNAKGPLIALSDSNNLGGQFFLGSGYIGTEITYLYYEHLPNGAIQGRNISASQAVIFEDTTEEAYIQTFSIQSHLGLWRYHVSTPRLAEFHVPQNSVLRTVKLDLKNN